LTSNKRIEAFGILGEHLLSNDNRLQEIIEEASYQNPWFTRENVSRAILAIAENLTVPALSLWVSGYAVDHAPKKTVGLVLAGNIPLVGFHDILCCLLCGFSIQLKLSSNDKLLIPYLLDKLQAIEPEGFSNKIRYVERLADVDMIIATGSNNTSRYFEYYFRNIPHIIRKNRNGVAILTGKESPIELNALGHDIFDYFGLGCRNISKIYSPKGYDYSPFFEAIESFSAIGNHYKYHNNYDYNKSIYLVNGDEHLDNGFLLLKKDTHIASPLAVVFYEEYDNAAALQDTLLKKQEEIQCIVGTSKLSGINTIPFGQSQKPALSDYADGIDVLEFLVGKPED